MDLKQKIRNIPDFPKAGIMFRDISTLLSDPESFKHTVDKLAEKFADKEIHKIVSIESRGFIFGAALAYKMGCSLITARKAGKLPHKTIKEEYELEYGTDGLELHTDSIEAGEKVLIVDDLLATGGTIVAACKLVEKLGGVIEGIGVIIELSFLPGRKKLDKYNVISLVNYDGE